MKEGQAENLTEEETNLKQELMKTGFRSWSKQDFSSFVTGCEKYGRKNMEMIAQLVRKSLPEV